MKRISKIKSRSKAKTETNRPVVTKPVYRKPLQVESRPSYFSKPKLFENRKVLFLGCKDGTLLFEMLLELKPEFINAIDRDISRLKKAVNSYKSLLEYFNNKRPKLNEIGLMSFRTDSLSAGLLAIGNFQARKKDLESKILFEHYDAFEYVKCKFDYQFDTIVCHNSLLKCMHIERGDADLKIFLMNLKNLLNEKGLIIFTSYKEMSYKKTAKRYRLHRTGLRAISMNQQGIQDYLTHTLALNKRAMFKSNDDTKTEYVVEKR